MRLLLIILFLAFLSDLKAPSIEVAYLTTPEKIMPYDALIKAVRLIESGNNNLAYNIQENAIGAFQIREIRLRDFNNRTGKCYTHDQCYDYEISKEIFLYYCDNPYETDWIIKSWNGSGPMAEEYLKRVKQIL